MKKIPDETIRELCAKRAIKIVGKFSQIEQEVLAPLLRREIYHALYEFSQSAYQVKMVAE